MKIFLLQSNDATFNDNKKKSTKHAALFLSTLISVGLTLFSSHENIEMLYLTQLKKHGILALM